MTASTQAIATGTKVKSVYGNLGTILNAYAVRDNGEWFMYEVWTDLGIELWHVDKFFPVK